MKPVVTRLLTVCAFSTTLAIAGIAQDKPATSTTNDPRVGLKAGFRDAAHAAKGMELVATMPRAEGFYDPKAPAGSVMGGRGGGGRGGGRAGAGAAADPASAASTSTSPPPPPAAPAAEPAAPT